MEERILDIDEDWDFGFSVVSEEELAQKEREALAEVEQVAADAEEYRRRLHLLRKMILPLLNNLAADGDNKAYIHWPNRTDKIKEFIDRVNKVVEGK